ncbi:MAG: hypothetical protein R3F59_34205 [Myxococcota bacterium]
MRVTGCVLLALGAGCGAEVALKDAAPGSDTAIDATTPTPSPTPSTTTTDTGTPPEGPTLVVRSGAPASRVSVGTAAACAVRDGALDCWGDGPVLDDVPTDSAFPTGSVADAGGGWACALGPDLLRCWGADPTFDPGRFEPTAAGWTPLGWTDIDLQAGRGGRPRDPRPGDPRPRGGLGSWTA